MKVDRALSGVMGKFCFFLQDLHCILYKTWVSILIHVNSHFWIFFFLSSEFPWNWKPEWKTKTLKQPLLDFFFLSSELPWNWKPVWKIETQNIKHLDSIAMLEKHLYSFRKWYVHFFFFVLNIKFPSINSEQYLAIWNYCNIILHSISIYKGIFYKNTIILLNISPISNCNTKLSFLLSF